MRLVRYLFICLTLVLFLFLLDTSDSQAQEEDWVAANGTYIGTMGMSGTYTVPGESFGPSGAGSEINWEGVGVGPLEITIEGGLGEGTWRIDGDALVDGKLGNGQIDISGSQTFGAGGELIGSFADLVIFPSDVILGMSSVQFNEIATIFLSGDVWTEAEITVTMNGQSTTRSGEKVASGADLALYYQAVSCTQIQGGWIEPAEERLEEAGIRPNFEGDWTVVRDDAISIEDRAEIQQLIDDLLIESLEYRDAISYCEEIDFESYSDFLGETYAMLDSLNRDLSCEYTGSRIRYLYPVTYAACMTTASYAFSSCENYNDSPDDLNILAMATVGLGCMGQGFFTSDQTVLDMFEGRLQDMMDGLDLSSEQDLITLAKLIGVGETLGLDDFVQSAEEAMTNSGIGE